MRPAARAEMYSYGEGKGSNGSTLKGVSGFSFPFAIKGASW